MALINCPECGHQVSDAAETCPSCGVRLSGIKESSPQAVPADTAKLQLQLKLAQLDLEWERERKRHVFASLYSKETVPRKWQAALAGIIFPALGIGAGLVFLSLDPLEHPEGQVVGLLLPAFFILIGLVAAIYSYVRAEAYEKAHAEYLRKKEEARLKYEGQTGSEKHPEA